MRKLFYHIMACCAAVLCLAACNDESELLGTDVVGDGNSIILSLSSGSLPLTRAVDTEAAGAEVTLDHIDVLVFDEDDNKVYHERVTTGIENRTGTIVLGKKRSDFDPGSRYWVYLIANSTADASVFAADDFTRGKLRGLTQEDPDIHMTGYPDPKVDVPQTFLMDGIAYPEGSEEEAATVVLNNGTRSDDTRLKVTLRRAAAKLVVEIRKGEDVLFNHDAELAGYYLRNMASSTAVVAGEEAEVKLTTSSLTDNDYFKWTQDADDPDNPNPGRPYTLITVTAYTYANEWKDASLDKETRLIVNIPMMARKRDEEGNYLDAAGNVVDQADAAYEDHGNSYYQIPVCGGSSLERNTCYKVVLTINSPGGMNPMEPVKLEPIDYVVRAWDWEENTINIGGEENRPTYLSVNESLMEMHNMEEDTTTLQFFSSSAVTVTIDTVYYINKFGQKQELEQRYPNDPTQSDVWAEKKITGSGTNRDPYVTTWSNECTIRITPDAGISGNIDVFGTKPENNAVRYIVFTVTNESGQTRQVKVAQYPLTYITNVEGWYSYRKDFVSTASDGTSGVTTWELLAGKSINKGTAYTSAQVPYDNTNAWICGCSWNSTSKSWSYGKTETGFFGSKVAYDFDTTTGLSNIEYARWTESRTGGTNNRRYTYDTSYATFSLTNHRMYHVTITASSGEYTLGRPRLDKDGYTDNGVDNAELVSPSFMLASQLGAAMTIAEIDGAKQHCERYVEVSRNGIVYDDWRLPTKAEIEIIIEYQYAPNAVMDEVLGGEWYWSASGAVQNSKGSEGSQTKPYLRCIRDAY